MRKLLILFILIASPCAAQDAAPSAQPTVNLTPADIEALRDYARAEGAANYAVQIAAQKARDTLDKINAAFAAAKKN